MRKPMECTYSILKVCGEIRMVLAIVYIGKWWRTGFLSR